ncbi:glycosyltransferase [Mesorhizobium sp. M1365]
MRVIQVVGSIDNKAAGPSYSVTGLAEALCARGVDAEIFSTSVSKSGDERGNSRVFSTDFSNIPGVRRLLFSKSLAAAIEVGAAAGAVLHAHGLWLMPNIYPGTSALRHRCPLVTSPRGMLGKEALQFSARKKQMFWMLAQRRVLMRSDCLHATSMEECEAIWARGILRPVAIVPNGVDIPPDHENARHSKRSDAAGESRTVLYLGRLHAKKGVDTLLQAWAKLQSEFPAWRLRIVGPLEGPQHLELRKLAGMLRLDRVTFENALFGDDKQDAYREAELFVLPTLNENFGMVIAEALASGTPIVTTKGAPWQGVVDNACGWWVDHGADSIAGSMASAMMLPRPELRRMGSRGRAWMSRDFSWTKVAANMEQVYKWTLGEAERPESVVLPGEAN